MRLISGLTRQLWHLLPYASRVALPHTCKARFRLAGSASTGWESNPLDRYERSQVILIFLLSCSPDATGVEASERPAPPPHLRSLRSLQYGLRRNQGPHDA